MTPRSVMKCVIPSIFGFLLLYGAAAATDLTANAKPRSVFLIQTGAFKSDEKAHAHCNPLTAAGFPLQVVKIGTSGRSVWFICRSVDAFERDHANEIAASLKSKAGVPEVILLPVTLGADKPTNSPSRIPNDVRAQFEKFLSERDDSQPVQLFEEFTRRQGRLSN